MFHTILIYIYRCGCVRSSSSLGVRGSFIHPSVHCRRRQEDEEEEDEVIVAAAVT
jgi:hypothetical protein